MVRSLDCSVEAVSSSREAIDIIQRQSFQAALVDLRMPPPGGLEVLARLSEIQPSCFRILMSGNLDRSAVISAVNETGVQQVLEKPLNLNQLAELLASVRHGAHLEPETRRVVIADDHGLMRIGLRTVLGEINNLEVVGEAKDGEEALELIEKLSPHLAVLNVSLPRASGLQVTRQVRQRCSQVRVLILSSSDEPALMREALAAGASGYLTKHSVSGELKAAIGAILEGRTYIQVSMEPRTAAGWFAGDHTAGAALSIREQEVLCRLAMGYSSREIAEQLAISEKTVATYKSRLVDKLGLKRRADLVRFALQAGILTPDMELLALGPTQSADPA